MTTETQTGGNGGKGGRVIIIVAVLIIIILLAVIAVLLLRRGGNDEPVAPAESDTRPTVRMVEDETTAENIMDQMREEVKEGMFECQMSMNWTFADGTSPSRDAYVANSTNNTYPIYFDVLLADTEEVIYSSPVLPVGATHTNFALDKDLEPGEYEATVMYTLIRDVETQEEISSAGFVITITVQN